MTRSQGKHINLAMMRNCFPAAFCSMVGGNAKPPTAFPYFFVAARTLAQAATYSGSVPPPLIMGRPILTRKSEWPIFNTSGQHTVQLCAPKGEAGYRDVD